MQRPASRLPWKLGSWCERCPAKGGRSGERGVKRGWGEKVVRGNGGWKQTLLEICITTPRGGQRRWMGKRGQGVLSVEKAGAHTSIRGTTPRPELLRHLSELLPPVHHLALAPLSTFPYPFPSSCHPLVPPSLSRATFCVPAMPPVPSVYVIVWR